MGKVERVLPYGIFVRLDDGTRAYIRRREMSWAADVEPRELVQEGQRVEAIVLKLPSSGRSMELSMKACLPDPWDEFVGRFRQGDIIEGTVKHLAPYGIFVEILPGVNGLVPLLELALWKVDRPEDVYWIGDDVEGLITRIESKTRKVWLSVRLRMKQLARIANQMASLDQRLGGGIAVEEKLTLSQKELEFSIEDWEPAREKRAEPYELERVGRVLVVDDHDEVCGPLVKWLRDRGYQADSARTPDEAREMIQQQPYGVLLA